MILITGGAGSFGRGFVEHLRKKDKITVIDNNEWALAELQKDFPDVECKLEDFSEWRFDQNPCDVVIHCAAYKHVNLGEENPNSFIDNNIIKTRKLFAEAFKNNVDILFLSTDKAVEPISLYGYSKAIGEVLCSFYNGSVARCGNILNSSGSVIPVWEKAIAENKPLPVTDIRMTRYVIEVEDAVKQIWKRFKKGEKLIIPDMEEVSLKELVLKTLNRHNQLPNKYPIEIIGIRPGEKLKEKTKWEREL
jgi:FlaA1/EpsC-like NDP-sugar epimerase